VDTRPSRGDVIIEDDDIDFDFDGVESGSDINVYDDEAEDHDSNNNMDDEEEDGGDDDDDDDSSMADLGHDSYPSESHESWQDGQAAEAPEDEPWPGIDDVENRHPDVNIHVDDDVMTEDDAGGDDTESMGSSLPSEYPSNEPPWVTSGREQEFRVFEDK
jgi:hypothetical protein